MATVTHKTIREPRGVVTLELTAGEADALAEVIDSDINWSNYPAVEDTLADLYEALLAIS